MHPSQLTFRRIASLVITLSVFVTNAHAVEIMKRPLRYLDTKGREISSYCVVPLYAKSHGIGWGPEATGRKSEPERYLRSPRSIKEGDGLYDQRPKERAKGLALLGSMPVTFGNEAVETKFVVLKRGFLPVLSPSYIDATRVEDIPMVEGSSEDTVDLLLSTQPDLKSLRSLFSLQEHVPVLVEYTSADRELLRKCYYEGDRDSQ